MSAATIEAALARWQQVCHGAFRRLDENAFELTSERIADYKAFLMFENYETGEVYLHYFVPVAVVEDMNAAPALLAMNRGGAKNSDFFFSITRQGDLIFLLLESKAVDRKSDEENIFWRLFNWWESHIFMTSWVLPEGLAPVHPGFAPAPEQGEEESGAPDE